MAATEPLPAHTLATSEVSARTGLSPGTLRYDEKAGLQLRVRARGDAGLAERLALLRGHRARLHERIRAPRTSGRALNDKTKIHEDQLGDSR